MESHGNLLLQLYGLVQGCAAEYWGEANLAEDRWVRTVGCPARARKWYAAQAPAFRSHLDGFAAGINAYVRAHPERIVDSVKPVLPIYGVDVLGHHQPGGTTQHSEWPRRPDDCRRRPGSGRHADRLYL